jgi:hypothetical protein
MIFVIRLFLFYRYGSCILCYIIKYHIGHHTGIIPVEQKQHYDKYDIAQNTGTIPVEQKQPYDKYDIAQNRVTIHVEQKQPV